MASDSVQLWIFGCNNLNEDGKAVLHHLLDHVKHNIQERKINIELKNGLPDADGQLVVVPCLYGTGRIIIDIKETLDTIPNTRKHDIVLIGMNHLPANNQRDHLSTAEQQMSEEQWQLIQKAIDVRFWNNKLYDDPMNTNAIRQLADYIIMQTKPRREPGKLSVTDEISEMSDAELNRKIKRLKAELTKAEEERERRQGKAGGKSGWLNKFLKSGSRKRQTELHKTQSGSEENHIAQPRENAEIRKKERLVIVAKNLNLSKRDAVRKALDPLELFQCEMEDIDTHVKCVTKDLTHEIVESEFKDILESWFKKTNGSQECGSENIRPSIMSCVMVVDKNLYAKIPTFIQEYQRVKGLELKIVAVDGNIIVDADSEHQKDGITNSVENTSDKSSDPSQLATSNGLVKTD